ncbi:MAG: AMMECR1 domain-containing protein, partial [Planctomycetota bacterium]
MNDKQKKSLLKIARSAVQATINEWTPPTPIADDPELNTKCGCFVTLTNAGQLRGCIGQFTSKKPVAELVSEMAIAATVNDRRFISNP